MKDSYGRTPVEIADYYITMGKGGSKRVLAESHADLLKALKVVEEFLLEDQVKLRELVQEAIKKAEQ